MTQPDENLEPPSVVENDPYICPKCRNELQPGVNCSSHGYPGVRASEHFRLLDPKVPRHEKRVNPTTHRKLQNPDTF